MAACDEFTATGDYEVCMDGLATELADWAEEPSSGPGPARCRRVKVHFKYP